MNNRLKLALVALLGFSTACSSVKNTTKDKDKEQELNSLEQQGPDRRIVVMYGVRPPQPKVQQDSTQIKKIAEDLEPVVEDPEK